MTDQEILLEIGRFSDQDILVFQNTMRPIRISKKTRLLTIGEVSQSTFFLRKGSVIQYHKKGDDHVNYIDLHVENDWVFNHQSFVNQEPATCHMEAYEDCELYELTIQQLHSLIGQSPAFFQMGKILSQINDRLQFYDQNHSPAMKLDYLMQNRPTLFQTFPLKIIASYLKVTPETLSRLRANY